METPCIEKRQRRLPKILSPDDTTTHGESRTNIRLIDCYLTKQTSAKGTQKSRESQSLEVAQLTSRFTLSEKGSITLTISNQIYG